IARKAFDEAVAVVVDLSERSLARRTRASARSCRTLGSATGNHDLDRRCSWSRCLNHVLRDSPYALDSAASGASSSRHLKASPRPFPLRSPPPLGYRPTPPATRSKLRRVLALAQPGNKEGLIRIYQASSSTKVRRSLA